MGGDITDGWREGEGGDGVHGWIGIGMMVRVVVAAWKGFINLHSINVFHEHNSATSPSKMNHHRSLI